MLDNLRQDLRHAARALRHSPRLAASALLVLALAIGANTAVFSLVNGVLRRPLPWPESDRLVRVREHRQGDMRGWRLAGITNDTFDAWQQSATTIDALGAWSSRSFTLTGEGEPIRLQATAGSPTLFDVLDLAPTVGRRFRPEEASPGANRLIILSHALWRERFGGDPAAIGRVVVLDAEPYTVVGVAPPSFYFPDRETRLWVPLHVPPPDPASAEQRNVFFFSALARLKPGVTPAQASAEATSVARARSGRNLAESAMFGQGGTPTVEVRSLLESVTDRVRPALFVLLAAVGVVLLVACANLASLLLAWGLARRREFAIRASIGAGHGRLVRQVMLEGLLLGVFGGALGTGLAVWMIRWLPSLAPADFPRLDDVAIDGPVLVFSLVVSVASGLLAGLAPSLQGARLDLVAILNEGGAALGGGLRRLRTHRARAALLVGEIALAITLLFGAGLLARSFVSLATIDPGFDASNVLTARVSFPRASYDRRRVTAALEALLARVRQMPMVTAAGTVNLLPLIPGETMVMFDSPFGGDARGPGRLIRARLRVVSPGFIEAMGVRLTRGRSLTWNDTTTSPPVLVVNEAFVREQVDGRPPLGIRLPGALEGPERDWEIVGVVSDLRQASLDTEPMPEVWVSWTQLTQALGMGGGTITVAIRATGDPAALAPLLRDALREVDPELAMADVATMDRRVAASVAQPRFAATLLGALALTALLLAATGIYGVLAHGVAQRRREIGVRAVLGASPATLVRFVAGQGLALTGLGLVLGLVGALAIAPLLSSVLYGVTPRDPLTLATVVPVVLIVAALATWLPAHRAARIDPAETLRAN